MKNNYKIEIVVNGETMRTSTMPVDSIENIISYYDGIKAIEAKNDVLRYCEILFHDIDTVDGEPVSLKDIEYIYKMVGGGSDK